eukprot:3099391-Rhodomonas_salina.5
MGAHRSQRSAMEVSAQAERTASQHTSCSMRYASGIPGATNAWSTLVARSFGSKIGCEPSHLSGLATCAK